MDLPSQKQISSANLDQAIVEDYDFTTKIHSYIELENVVKGVGESLKRTDRVINNLNSTIVYLIKAITLQSEKIDQLEEIINSQKVSIDNQAKTIDHIVNRIGRLEVVISKEQESVDRLSESIQTVTQEIRSFETKVVAQEERDINKAIREFSLMKKKQKVPDPIPFHVTRSFFGIIPQMRRNNYNASSSHSQSTEITDTEK